MSKAYVVSICDIKRSFVDIGDVGAFEIPAAPAPGKYVVKEYDDRIHYFDVGDGKRNQAIIGGDALAADIVKYAGPGFGYMVIDHAVPTADELRELRKQQIAHCEQLIADGDRIWNQYGRVQMIEHSSKWAARLLNVKRDWLLDAQVQSTCPACAEPVQPRAIICKHCHTNMKEFAEKQKAPPAPPAAQKAVEVA
jgi:hypothetical protein